MSDTPFLDDRAALEAARLEGVLRAPAGLYCTGDEQLRLTVLNAASGVTVAIRGRFLDLDGHVERLGDTLVPATDRSASTLTLRLGRGWLQNVAVIASAGTPLSGQCFVQLSLIRGEGSIGLDETTLAAGYVTAVQRIAWPGGLVLNSLEGGGALRSIAGTTPGAGAEVSETVPTGARWELLAITMLLTSNATVSNRGANLTLDDGANVYGRFAHVLFVTAGLAAQLTWAAGVAVIAAGNAVRQTSPIPAGNRLGAGHRIRTSTDNIQAGDQFSAIRYLVREWIEGA